MTATSRASRSEGLHPRSPPAAGVPVSLSLSVSEGTYSHVHSHSQTDPLYSPSSPDLSSGAAPGARGSLPSGGGKGPSSRTAQVSGVAQVSGAAQVSGGVAAVTSQRRPGRRGPGRSALPVPCPHRCPGGWGQDEEALGGTEDEGIPVALGPGWPARRLEREYTWAVPAEGDTLPTPIISPRPAFPAPDQPPPISAPLSRPWPIFPEPFASHHFRLASTASLTSRIFQLRAPVIMGSPPHAGELALLSLPAKASSPGGGIPCHLLAGFHCFQ